MLMVVPFFTSYLVRIYSWQVFLSDAGIINVMLGWFGLGPYGLLNTPGARLLGFATLAFPLVVLLQLFGLVFIDRTLIEAADNMRCGRLRDQQPGSDDGSGRSDFPHYASPHDTSG